MSVNFKSPLTSANTNSAFVSRTQDTSMIGQLDNQNPTDSSSVTTGAIKTAGGLGVAKKAYINKVFVESLAGSKALVTSSTKEIVESSVTDLELAELAGITGNVQVQIDTKANDNQVVHNTGNESVAGVKTFVDDVNFSANVVIDGNLTVNGTTTTINTETLDVEDKNVTINKNGTDATSEGSGLTIDRVGTKGSLIYQSSLASRFLAGDLGSESEIITANTTQTLTGEKIVYDLNINSNLSLLQTVDSSTTGADAVLPTANATVRLANSSLVSIASIDDVKAGKIVVVTNRTGNSIEIKNDLGTPAGLGVLTGTGEDFTLENNATAIFSYDSAIQRWFLIGGSGAGGGLTSGFQETPGGAVDGVNTTFGPLTYAAKNQDSLMVFVDGLVLKKTEFTLSGLNVVLNQAPTLGQSVYVFYLTSKVPVVPLPIIWGKESITLSAGDISNGYVDLSQSIQASSLDVFIRGILQREGLDYTINLTGGVGGKTRVTFAGNLSPGAAYELASGDVLFFKYQY